ncbi:hypothetical protein C8R42DRAFT_136151 [Lentinula raphanica]|nr:hypothetical protein C8R42DRAFT_136151 [Lentinula raphanica]
MTPEETELLKEAGELFVRDFACTVPLALLYGVYCLLAFQAVYTVLNRRKSKYTWILVTFLIVNFLITTTYFCLYEAIVFVLMQTALVKNTDLSLGDRFTIASDSILGLSIGDMWLGGVNGLAYISGDGIVVWRSWAIWNGRRSVLVLPLFFLFATFAIFITSCTIRTIADVNPSIIPPNTLFGSLTIAGFTASIATNFTSTVLIGIKAYQHRKFMNTLDMSNTMVVKILLLLTESGGLYIAFQIIQICVAFLDDSQLSNSSFNIASHVWGVVMNFVSAMYPMLIVLIVHRNKSMSDRLSTHVFNETHISFARSRPADSVEGLESQELEAGHEERAQSVYAERKSVERGLSSK